MKTAIDEIIECSYFFSSIDFKKWFNEEKGRLKHKNKQQIIKAYDDAFQHIVGGGFVTKTGEQYFKETYNDKN